jgi:hypothetical protein
LQRRAKWDVAMKIIKCPHCKEFVHFDAAPKAERCWHCGHFYDFAHHKSFEQKMLLFCDGQISRLLPQDFEFERFKRIGKIGLIAALPISALMLLLCNSLDIFVVHHVADSFASLRIFGAGCFPTGMSF